MPLAVDASAIAAIVFGEPEGQELANYCTGETLVAPTLLDFELANIGLKKIRRKLRLRADVIAAMQVAQGLRIERIAVPAVDALALADRTGLTAYDAAYLWVAIARDAELVTLDDDLARVNDQLREHF